MTTIGMLLFDDLEELDLVGPWEVFTMAAKGREDGSRVVSIAEKTAPIKCAKGLEIVPGYDLENAPELDVVLVPGGEGTRRELENQRLLAWLRKTGAECDWVTSVCTGALLLHAAGFTSGKRITTHWAFVETLRGLAKDATVLSNVRYVRDGNVVTAAGVSAGIDMALWLTGQLWGVDHARTTQRMMQYDPAPPYAADV